MHIITSSVYHVSDGDSLLIGKCIGNTHLIKCPYQQPELRPETYIISSIEQHSNRSLHYPMWHLQFTRSSNYVSNENSSTIYTVQKHGDSHPLLKIQLIHILFEGTCAQIPHSMPIQTPLQRAKKDR